MAEGDSATARAAEAEPSPPLVTAPAVTPREERRIAPPAPPQTAAALLRRVDEDRWLATRFAAAPVRDRLETLYSFLYEVARTPEVVSEPQLGVIRLAWWREALEDGAGGATGLVAAMRALIDETALDGDRVVRLIEARAKDLEAVPFEGWADLEAYIDATAGGAACLALQVCLAGRPWPRQAGDCAKALGRAWGFTGLIRAAGVWAARGRTFFPQRLLDHLGLSVADVTAAAGGHLYQQARLAMLDRARAAYLQAADLARLLPVQAFAAIGYLAFEPVYRARLLDGEADPRLSLLSRQVKLVKASALGRF